MYQRSMVRPTRYTFYRFACLIILLAVLAGGWVPPPGNIGTVRAATLSPQIVSSFTVPGNRTRALTWGNGSLWLADEDNKVYRLTTGGVVQSSFTLTFTVDGLAWDGNNLWAGSGWDGGAKRLDATGQIIETLPQAGYWPNSGLAWVGNDLYVGDYNDSTIHKHNRSGSPILSWTTNTALRGHPTGMAYNGSSLLIADSCEGAENKIAYFSVLGAVGDSFDFYASSGCTPGSVTAIAWDGQYLWLTNNATFTVYQLDISPPPTLSNITPNFTADGAGNVLVTIKGTNFRAPVSARLEDANLLNVTLQNDTTLQAVVPSSSLSQGNYDLTVMSGGRTITLPVAFTVKPVSIPPSPADQSWTQFWLPKNDTFYGGIGTIVVDPASSDAIYVATDNGHTGDALYRTTNGGATWPVFLDDFRSSLIAIDPTNSAILYAPHSYGSFTVLKKTTNGGTTWSELNCCPFSTTTRALTIDPSNTNKLYAGVERYATGTPGVYRSTNGGLNWSNALGNADILALAIDPAQPNILYAGGRKSWEATNDPITGNGGVYRSADGGVTWSHVFTHTQVNALAINPQNPQILYAATEGGGIFKSTNGGASWARANNGLSHLNVRALAIYPENPRVVYAGLWEGGVFRSLDGGESWVPINTGLSDTYINTLTIDPLKPYIMYAGTKSSGVFKWIGAPPPQPGSTYAHVVDAQGVPLIGAQIYHNGRLVVDENGVVQVTDLAGNLVLNSVRAGDTLVALLPQEKRSTARLDHDGWAYQVHTTSLNIQPDGVRAFSVTSPQGAQTLIVQPASPLVLFNLVVSIEWDANDAYTSEISRAVRLASDFFYDMTDGQMAFGQVVIHERGKQWGSADIQIATSNIVRPHSYIGGIVDGDASHVIRIGRAWDGNTGNQGSWTTSDGYRTLAHEFGHYALHLYDEYMSLIRSANGMIIGERPATCTGPENRNPATASVNASVMDYQYTSSELASRGVPGLWSIRCEATAQWQLNGESDWETLVRKYADSAQPPRWQFTTPADRKAVFAGPNELPPSVLNLPQIVISDGGAGSSGQQLTVVLPDGTSLRGAIVALHRQDGSVVSQGLTDTRGELYIYGAAVGDIIRASSFDGGWEGSITIQANESLRLVLKPVGGPMARAHGQPASVIPHLRVIASPSANIDQTDLLVGFAGLGPGIDPGLIVTAPGEAGAVVGSAPPLSYNAGTATYEGRINFIATERGTGSIRALAEAGGSVIRRQSTYRLQQVSHKQGQAIFSDDGNLELRFDAGSVTDQLAYAVVMSPGALPGPLPPGLAIVGDAYDITMSGGVATLAKPAALALRFDQTLVNSSEPPTGLAIYRWNPNNDTWQLVADGELDKEHTTMAAPVTALGTYALLAPSGKWTQPAPHLIFISQISR
jgi:photosystem II stability/assembly factor-like uncharacterized protein